MPCRYGRPTRLITGLDRLGRLILPPMGVSLVAPSTIRAPRFDNGFVYRLHPADALRCDGSGHNSFLPSSAFDHQGRVSRVWRWTTTTITLALLSLYARDSSVSRGWTSGTKKQFEGSTVRDVEDLPKQLNADGWLYEKQTMIGKAERNGQGMHDSCGLARWTGRAAWYLGLEKHFPASGEIRVRGRKAAGFHKPLSYKDLRRWNRLSGRKPGGKAQTAFSAVSLLHIMV
jgi:hypothetical protein